MSGLVVLTMARFAWLPIGGSEGGSINFMNDYFYASQP
jgi:hypothetical protein